MKPISILIPYKVDNNSNLLIWNQPRQSKDSLSSLMEFPGGKIELNETPLEACLREVSEEVGVNLRKQDISKFKTFSFNKSENKLLIINVFLHLDSLNNFDRSGWIKLSEINRSEILPNNSIIIDDFFSYYQQVIARARD